MKWQGPAEVDMMTIMRWLEKSVSEVEKDEATVCQLSDKAVL